MATARKAVVATVAEMVGCGWATLVGAERSSTRALSRTAVSFTTGSAGAGGGSLITSATATSTRTGSSFGKGGRAAEATEACTGIAVGTENRIGSATGVG